MIITTNKGLERLVETFISGKQPEEIDTPMHIWLEQHSTLRSKDRHSSFFSGPAKPIILPNMHYMPGFNLLLSEKQKEYGRQQENENKRNPTTTVDLFLCSPYPLPDRVIVTPEFEETMKLLTILRATRKGYTDKEGKSVPDTIQGSDYDAVMYINSQVYADKERILMQEICLYYGVNPKEKKAERWNIQHSNHNFGVMNVKASYMTGLTHLFEDVPEAYETIFRRIVSLNQWVLGRCQYEGYVPSAKVIICGDQETLERVKDMK